MVSKNQQAGKLGKMNVAGADLDITDWSVTPQNDVLDAFHTGAEGHKVYIYGLDGCKATFKATWDALTAPGSVPKIQVQTVLTNVYFYIGNPTNGEYILCPEMVVDERKITSAVAGKVEWELTATCNGAWTETTTSTAAPAGSPSY